MTTSEMILAVLCAFGGFIFAKILELRRRCVDFVERPDTPEPEDPFPSRLARGGYQPPPGGKPLTNPPTGGSNVMPPARVMDGESEMFNEIYSMGAKYAESDGVWANGENIMAGTARLRAVFRDFIAAARAGEWRAREVKP